jgi:hypothetical protein
MDRLRAWGILALLAALWAMPAFAADPDEAPVNNYDRGVMGFTKWNAGHPEPPKAPPVPPEVAAAKQREKDTAAALRAQEEANLLRRLNACNRLREVAVQTGDEKLEQLADELEKRAGAVFTARTTVLAGGKSLAGDEDQRVAAGKREGKK